MSFVRKHNRLFFWADGLAGLIICICVLAYNMQLIVWQILSVPLLEHVM